MSTLRLACRQLAKSPGFTLAAVLVLALGVGVNTAVFSVVEATLLRPLPFSEPDRLVRLTEGQDYLTGRENTYELPEATYQQWQEHGSQVFAGLAASAPTSVTLGGNAGEPPQHLSAAKITASFLPILGLAPARGRNFTAEEDRPNGPSAALLSHELWQRQFGGRPDILGQTVQLDGRPHTIVGIMPPHFRHPYRAEVWVPLVMRFDPPTLRYRYLDTIARLQPGISLEAADAAMRRICAEVNAAAPDTYNAKRAQISPLREELVANLRPKLLTIYGAALCTLLIAALNFAGLLLARAVEREGEVAVRVALGASPRQILRQSLAQPFLLALAGTLLGLLLALWATPALVAFSPDGVDATGISLREFDHATGLNLPVLLSATGTMLIIGIGCGLLPAWRALRTDPKSAMSRQTRGARGDRGTHRLLDLLVIAEIAVALVLLVGAGLLARQFRTLIEQPWGFATEQRLVFKVNLGAACPDAASRIRTVEELERQLRTLPGVGDLAAITPHPLHNEPDAIGLNAEGAVAPEPRGYTFSYNFLVTPGYFRAAGQSLLQGRDFTVADQPGAAYVCIVSEDYARRAWPGQDPIGKRIKWGRYDNPKRPWLTVVGVTSEIRNTINESYGASGAVYFPLGQFLSTVLSNDEFSFVLHTEVPPQSLERQVRLAVARVNPAVAAYDFIAMDDYAAQTRVSDRFALTLVTLFGGLGLLLSATGLYSLLTLQVAAQWRDIGVRLAIGASGTQVMGLVLRRGLLVLGGGALLGGSVAWASARLARSWWPGLPDFSLPVFTGALGVITVIVLLASWLPARRASRIDPLVALKTE